MSAFDIRSFTIRLIGESLFYDEEYGAIGNISLISMTESKERFIAYYVPEEGHYVIDEATGWDDYDPAEDGDIGYAFAVDTIDYTTAKSLKEIAREVLALSEKYNLYPSASLFFEDEEDG